jgi:hypothetical protein
MQELIDAVKDWPVIVQGTLGSALFWLILVCSQFINSRIAEIYSKHSRAARLSWLISAQAKYASEENDIETIMSMTTLVYRSSRYLYKALLWLVLGLIFESFLLPADIIGFCGCLYYLLKAYEVVSPIEAHENTEEILKKINEEIKAIESTSQ